MYSQCKTAVFLHFVVYRILWWENGGGGRPKIKKAVTHV